MPDAGTEPVTHDIAITFEARGAKTFLTLLMVFPSTANLDWAIKTYGLDSGLTPTIEQLEDYAANELGELRIVRVPTNGRPSSDWSRH